MNHRERITSKITTENCKLRIAAKVLGLPECHEECLPKPKVKDCPHLEPIIEAPYIIINPFVEQNMMRYP